MGRLLCEIDLVKKIKVMKIKKFALLGFIDLSSE